MAGRSAAGLLDNKQGLFYCPARLAVHPYRWATSSIFRDPHGVATEPSSGAIAQLGERVTGSHEVRGSIPLGSTNLQPPRAFTSPRRLSFWRWLGHVGVG